MISNETQYDNQQLAQLQNELKDNELYSGIGIIPGTDIGGGSEGGENGTVNPPTNSGGNTGTNTGENTGSNTNTGGDNQNQNATVKPSENQNPGGGTIVDGKTNEDPKFYVVSGEEIAASFYQSDVTIQIFTNDRTKKIKYILTTTVDAITNELYPSGLVRELDIENGGTLTFTKDGEYTITAYAYDTAGNKSNPTIMWFKRQVGGSTTGGITVSVASGNRVEGNEWYTSNVTLRVLGTTTGSSEVRYRVQGTVTNPGLIGDVEVTEVGNIDTEEIKIANGTTFKITADGEFSISALDYDAGGMRLSTSEVLSLKKDATRPTINSYIGEQIPGNGFKVTVDAVDYGSKLTVNAYTYRYRLAETNGEYASITTSEKTKLYTGLNQQKTYDMYVVVTDQAGNMSITDVISKPSLWVSMGTAGEISVEGARSYYRSDNVAMSFRGQDSNNVDISKTTYQIIGTVTEGEVNGKVGSMDGILTPSGTILAANEKTIEDKETKTIQLQANGNWTVKVRNYNEEGDVVSTNIFEITRDTISPTIKNFSIETLSYGKTGSGVSTVGEIVDLTSGWSSNKEYEFYQENILKISQTSNTFAYTGITSTNMPKVRVKDKAGNSNTKELDVISKVDFSYVGQIQTLTMPAGKYRLEVWGGAGGAGGSANGGAGGYSVGELTSDTPQLTIAIVGGQANSINGRIQWRRECD